MGNPSFKFTRKGFVLWNKCCVVKAPKCESKERKTHQAKEHEKWYLSGSLTKHKSKIGLSSSDNLLPTEARIWFLTPVYFVQSRHPVISCTSLQLSKATSDYDFSYLLTTRYWAPLVCPKQKRCLFQSAVFTQETRTNRNNFSLRTAKLAPTSPPLLLIKFWSKKVRVKRGWLRFLICTQNCK